MTFVNMKEDGRGQRGPCAILFALGRRGPCLFPPAIDASYPVRCCQSGPPPGGLPQGGRMGAFLFWGEKISRTDMPDITTATGKYFKMALDFLASGG